MPRTTRRVDLSTLRSSRSLSRLNRWAIATIAVGFAVTAYSLKQEMRVYQAREMLISNAMVLNRKAALPPRTEPIDGSLPLRAMLPRAQATLLSVPYAKDAAMRRSMLADADTAIASVERGRPLWGEAAVARAYLESLQERPEAKASAALVESYRRAPYLREAASWRVRYALSQWAYLPEDVRRKTVDEAVWFARLRPEYRDELIAAFRVSPAYQSFMTRWREVRAGDSDLADVE